MPDKGGLTEFLLLAETVVYTVGFVAVKAVSMDAGPVASLFDRRRGGVAGRRLGGI